VTPRVERRHLTVRPDYLRAYCVRPEPHFVSNFFTTLAVSVYYPRGAWIGDVERPKSPEPKTSDRKSGSTLAGASMC